MLVGVQKMVWLFWNTCLVVFYINKVKCIFTIWSRNFILRYLFNINKNTYLQKELYKNALSKPYDHKLEIIWMSNNRKMDKQIGVYLYNKIPLINNKESTTDTQNNINVHPNILLSETSQIKATYCICIWACKNARKLTYDDTNQKWWFGGRELD